MFIVWTSDQTASPRTTGSPRTSQGCILKSLEDFRSKIKNFTRNCKFLRKVQILRENLKEILGPSHPHQFLVLSWTTVISFLKKPVRVASSFFNQIQYLWYLSSTCFHQKFTFRCEYEIVMKSTSGGSDATSPWVPQGPLRPSQGCILKSLSDFLVKSELSSEICNFW